MRKPLKDGPEEACRNYLRPFIDTIDVAHSDTPMAGLEAASAKAAEDPTPDLRSVCTT